MVKSYYDIYKDWKRDHPPVKDLKQLNGRILLITVMSYTDQFEGENPVDGYMMFGADQATNEVFLISTSEES